MERFDVFLVHISMNTSIDRSHIEKSLRLKKTTSKKKLHDIKHPEFKDDVNNNKEEYYEFITVNINRLYN